jgi:hypothetical protein
MSLAIGIIPLALYLLAIFDYICIYDVLQYFLSQSTLQNAGVGTSDHNVGGDYPCRFFCLATFFVYQSTIDKIAPGNFPQFS